jgi:hypothetical protein
MGWYFVVAVVLVVGVVVGRRTRSRSSRQRDLMRSCADAGLAYAAMDPFADTTMLPFRLFGWGSPHSVENVVWDGGDRAIRVFDLSVQPPDTGARRSMTCGVVPLPFAVPPIAIWPRGEVDPSEEPLIGEVVHLELDAFERRFEVRAVEPHAAVTFLDQRMMAALLRLPLTVAVHVHEDRMLLVSHLLEPGDVLVLLACAKGLAERVPAVVASLYPPRPAEGPYEHRWLQGSWSPDPTSADAPHTELNRADPGG